MSIPITFQGVGYSVPQTDEEGWDNSMTNYLVALSGLGNLATLVGTVLVARWSSANSALAAGATLTPTANWHRISGTPGAVTLDVTTAIADGGANGQILLLTGTDAVNTVSITSGANVELNGNITIGLGDAVLLLWENSLSYWQEIARNS